MPFAFCSYYGISYYNDQLLAPVNIIPGANDYGKIQIFEGKFYFHSISGTAGNSLFYRYDTIPRSPVALPSPLFQSGSVTARWMDFDVFSDRKILIGGVEGLELWQQGATGAWTQAYSNSDRPNIVGVGLSVDRSTAYVSTASTDGSNVFSWDCARQEWFNGGQPLLTAPAGTQFRGVAAAPIPASSTPTSTPSSTGTGTSTPSNTPSPSTTGKDHVSMDAYRSVDVKIRGLERLKTNAAALFATSCAAALT